MPELPDVTIYVEALKERIVGEPLLKARMLKPFVLRSVDPPLSELEGCPVHDVFRLGKRIVIDFGNDLFVVIHLMIAGRLLWRKPSDGGWTSAGKIGLATFDFSAGRLVFTEASSHKRASIYAVRGRDQVHRFHSGGIEPLECTFEEFSTALRKENHTMKRALTDPRILSGVGNAYSDEILHFARLSPFRQTQSLPESEMQALYDAVQAVLTQWTNRLRSEFNGKFPDSGQMTAFRPEFAAHRKFGKPCPDCGMPIQRIRYAETETNYCAKCQVEGRVLADRSLSRLLKDDWPKTIEELAGG